MKKGLVFAFSLIGQIGFSVAVPLVAFGLTGRYLDQRFQTKPWLFLLGIAIATVIIFFYLRKIIREAVENFKDL